MTAIGTVNAQPAVSVMRLIVSQQQQRPEDKTGARGLPASQPPAPQQAQEASDDFYFGTQMTVTKLMYSLMEHVVSYLNDKLAQGSDGDAEQVKQADAWRDGALVETIPVGSQKDFSIPEPGKNGVTFREVATMIEQKFNMNFLAQDRDLIKYLDRFLGFRLDGASPADIVEAFADPTSDAYQKVRDALDEGLAGQEGSKVSQRLERAADGPKSVSEVLADKKSPADVVDEETLQEDRDAVEAARMNERLDGIREMEDKVAKAVDAKGPADGHADPEAAQQAIDAALGIIQDLSDEKPDAEAPKPDDAKAGGAAKSDASLSDAPKSAEDELKAMEADEADAEALKDTYAALAEAYAQDPADPREPDDRDKPRLLFAI